MASGESMWFLNGNVYFVPGKCNAAFYDFNNCKLYSINSEAKELVQRLLQHEELELNQQEKGYIDNLLNCRILTENEVPLHSIKDLKSPYSFNFAWIEVTNICNLKCSHCYEEATTKCGRKMSFDIYKHIIDELELMGISKIQLIGGEPFCLGEDIFEYLDYANMKFTYIEIFTNGTLIRDSWIDRLNCYEGIHIALSLYSYDKKEHAKVTKDNCSWDLTNDTIKKLRKHGIPYRVCNVLMDGVSIGEQNTDLYRLHTDKDVVRITGRANVRLLNEDLLKKKLITKDNFTGKLSKEFTKRCIDGHNCFSSKLYFALDGTIYPCVMERRNNYGTIDTGSRLKDILSDEFQKINKDYIDTCKECEFRYTCFDCRADSKGNNFLSKPWYCTYDPETGQWKDLNKCIEEILSENNI